MRRSYSIHPSIGIARVGNSPTDFYFAPEAPFLYPLGPSDGRYRDAAGLVKRQAARFRIFEFTYSDGPDDAPPTAVREITAAEAEISWSVQLVNAKAMQYGRNPDIADDAERRRRLAIDSGFQTLASTQKTLRLAGTFNETIPVNLGEMRSDDEGRLIVMGGAGVSASWSGRPMHREFGSTWYDDTADGPVHARIQLRATGESPAVESAWLVVAPPDFSPGVQSVVTLFDIAEDAAREAGFATSAARPVSFVHDIYPVLHRMVSAAWVSSTALEIHGPGRPWDFLDPPILALLANNDTNPESEAYRARHRVLRELKNPRGAGGGLPHYCGMTLTKTQFDRFTRWARGEFIADGIGPATPIPYGDLPVADRPAALDRASLEDAVGGPLGPGIDVGPIVTHPRVYSRPFRIEPTTAPGTLTGQLTLPWQAEYFTCNGWWPGVRPQLVSPDGQARHPWIPEKWGVEDMATAWAKLGFVTRFRSPTGRDQLLEQERATPVDARSPIHSS